MSNPVFGIDVSRWQGNFNFAKAKAEGVQFAIIKAGGGDDGLYKDSKFEQYYKDAKAQGIGVGAYFFGRAFDVATAQREADKFLSILKGKQFEYPVYYDVEGDMVDKQKGNLSDIIIAFCDRVEKAGYYVGVYAGKYTFDGNPKIARYAAWLAYWTKKKPSLKYSSVDMWQFGGSTNLIRTNIVAGVVCDQDYCYIDYPTTIKKLGLNGYSAQPQPAPTPTPTPAPPTPPTPPTPQPTPTPHEGSTVAHYFDANKYSRSYKVIAQSGLNVRSGIGTSTISKGVLPYGSMVNCYGYYDYDNSGRVWLYVSTKYGSGFCCKDYLQ